MTGHTMHSATSAAETGTRSPHLFGRWSDAAALGGGSLLLLPLVALLPNHLDNEFLLAFTLISLAINYPHFAASYGIFYADFGRKITPGYSADPTLHLRYRFAGIIAPATLTIALLTLLLIGNPEWYGLSLYVMSFTVGWHYVKQGYGMAMVDAAFKHQFFTDDEKRALRLNAYSAWIAAWLVGNARLERTEYLELPIIDFDPPRLAVTASVIVLVASSLSVIRILIRRAVSGTPTPWTGIAAYAASLYPWMVLVTFDPIIVHVVPTLHSLQYLWVVARYQKNKAAADPTTHSWRRIFFRCVLAGVSMFWVIPLILDGVVPIDDSFGTYPFLFMFWVIINVHHYFLDNVMWRRGNPDVAEHLFGRPATTPAPVSS